MTTPVITVTRRAALATMAAGLGLGAAACAGFRVGATRPVPDDVVLLTVWAGTAEEAAFRALADGFRDATGTEVALQIVPSSLPVLLLFVVAQRSFVTGLARTGMK